MTGEYKVEIDRAESEGCFWYEGGENEKQKKFDKPEFVCEKPANRRMLICVACGNGSVDIESSHQKQGGREYA